jgi:hypothetical protein
MTEIILNSEQNAVLRAADGEVLFRDAEGKALAVVDVKEYLLFEKAKKDSSDKSKGVSSSKAREYLQRLQQEIDSKGEMSNEDAITLVQSFRIEDSR